MSTLELNFLKNLGFQEIDSLGWLQLPTHTPKIFINKFQETSQITKKPIYINRSLSPRTLSWNHAEPKPFLLQFFVFRNPVQSNSSPDGKTAILTQWHSRKNPTKYAIILLFIIITIKINSIKTDFTFMNFI